MDTVSALPFPTDTMIRECEDRAFRAWPSESALDLSGWVVRHARHASTRRTNSVYPSRLARDADPAAVLRQVEEYYAGHGLPVRFQISPASMPEDIDGRLDERGYRREAETVVEWALAREISKLDGAERPSRVTIGQNMTDDWARAYGCGLESEQDLNGRLAVIDRIGQPKALAKLLVDDQVQAVGLGIYDTGWTGIFCMFTKPESRRKGYAHLILDALAHWSSKQGGEHMYLQVEKNNAPARTFYEGRGFIHAYGYHYRTSPK